MSDSLAPEQSTTLHSHPLKSVVLHFTFESAPFKIWINSRKPSTFMNPLLITTAINPPENVYALKMTDTEKRYILSKAAIFFWVGYGLKKIVIADATQQTLLSDADLKILSNMNVEVEQIYYQQDNNVVVEKGKGYGEGSLINFAINNSNILKESKHFFKCTGKVFCRNFTEIQSLIQKNNIESIFWQEPLKNKIDTRFFYTSIDFSKNFLIPYYEKIDDRKGVYSEHVIFDLARSKLASGKSLRPLLSGFSGSTNMPYFDQSLGYFDTNYPCWLSRQIK